MSLTLVVPSAAPPTLNVLLYGPEGSGKTFGACSAPGPILVANGDGTGALADARAHFGDEKIREVTVDGPRALDEIELHLLAGGDGERSVVLDSLPSIYVALIDFYAAGGRPSLPNYGDARCAWTASVAFCATFR